MYERERIIKEQELLKAISDMMDDKLEPLKTGVADLKTRVTNLEINQETIIIPGIKELCSAYHSEFDKYQILIEGHQQLVTDVDALKTVMPHHSEQIAELQQVCGL